MHNIGLIGYAIKTIETPNYVNQIKLYRWNMLISRTTRTKTKRKEKKIIFYKFTHVGPLLRRCGPTSRSAKVIRLHDSSSYKTYSLLSCLLVCACACLRLIIFGKVINIQCSSLYLHTDNNWLPEHRCIILHLCIVIYYTEQILFWSLSHANYSCFHIKLWCRRGMRMSLPLSHEISTIPHKGRDKITPVKIIEGGRRKKILLVVMPLF